MRLDRQHKEPHTVFLGVKIYPGSYGMAPPRWFVDMCQASARLARKYRPELEKGKIGASTGGTWSCLWAWENLPEPYKSELREFYLQVVLEKTEERKRKDAERTANTPAT